MTALSTSDINKNLMRKKTESSLSDDKTLGPYKLPEGIIFDKNISFLSKMQKLYLL